MDNYDVDLTYYGSCRETPDKPNKEVMYQMMDEYLKSELSKLVNLFTKELMRNLNDLIQEETSELKKLNRNFAEYLRLVRGDKKKEFEFPKKIRGLKE
jgi:hypothetical protein